MKKIICYGDSNTFGYNPKDGTRFDENIRWTSLLQKNLGVEYEVINEGMCDRTGFVSNPKGELFSASKHFPEFIKKSGNIDLLILWIGTNDLQFLYNTSLSTIEQGLENSIKLAKTKAKKILIISPVILNENILKGAFNYQFDNESINKSKNVGKIYKRFADLYNCKFFDIAEKMYVEQFITEVEIANRIGVSDRTIRRWKALGDWGIKRDGFLKANTISKDAMYALAHLVTVKWTMLRLLQ